MPAWSHGVKDRLRSPAAAAASRRNGARSQGPCTAAGRAVAAGNARKHGLFSSRSRHPGGVPPSLAGLVEELEFGSTQSFAKDIGIARVVEAAIRLTEATRLLDRVRDELSEAVFDDESDTWRFGPLIEQIARIGRYQRRFRGQRDRALRALT